MMLKCLAFAFLLFSGPVLADSFPPYIGQPVGPGLLSTSGGIYLAPAGGNGSGAEQTVSFQPGLAASVVNTKGAVVKFVKASTVDNLMGSATSFTCTGNPTITFYECGTDLACATSPATIGTVTVTTAGTAVAGTVSAPTITAGDYVAWAVSAGTCTALDIAGTAQIHAN